MVDPETGVEYMTPNEYLILPLPLRRQKQHLAHGKAVPEHSKHVDLTTGQVTGVSQSSRITLPELMIMDSAGAEKGIEELLKARGGDQKAMKMAKRQTIDTGVFTLQSLGELGSRPTATETMAAIFYAMHLDNNI